MLPNRVGPSSILLLLSLLAAAPAYAAPQATMSIRQTSEAAVGMPICFELVVANTGKEPFWFWPGGCPTADWFSATIVEPSGNERRVQFFNGQSTAGSGTTETVEPGKRIKVPVACEPLGRGSHRLTMLHGQEQLGPTSGGGQRITWPKIEATSKLEFPVWDDPAVARRVAEEFLRQVREEDWFGTKVAAHFRVELVVNAMMSDLSSNNGDAVGIACGFLWGVRPLPPGLGPVIERNVPKWLRADGFLGVTELNAIGAFCSLAAREGSDDALRAVILSVRDLRVLNERPFIVQDLSSFKQPLARQTLRELLSHINPQARRVAATMLAGKRDAAAIPVLIEAAGDADDSVRRGAIYRLGDLGFDDRAMHAIEAAINDPSAIVREAAQSAIKDARRARTSTRPSTGPASVLKQDDTAR